MVRDLFARAPRRFVRAERGNVAMMWALMGAVLVGLIGITVDFTRAQALRSQMQNAADGAALVAERNSNQTMAQRSAAARAFFDAEMGQNATVVTFNVRQLTDGGHEVDVEMPMPLSLARLVRGGDWTLHVDAVAQADASPPIEVALVLDNTGSMSRDMQALRDAASDLAEDLMSLDGDTVRVSLVPFVAQVNIGNAQSHMAWMDAAGAAPMNGELFEDRMIAHHPRANTNRCADLPTAPNNYPGTYRLTWVRGGGVLGGLLGGGNASGARNRCYAWTPADGINYFTLFDLISNDAWKGCVEARPVPYDVNDAAPNPGAPETMFVPFFWLDTLDQENIPNSYRHDRTENNYLDDDTGDLPGANMVMTTSMGASDGSPEQVAVAHMLNPFRYRGGSASIATEAPEARGPNRGCPTPIVPLTTNAGAIQSNIAAMRHWSGGGTNQAEGLAWGWRVLSPTAPFTEGVAYNAARDNVRKVIVLMSDGENTNVGEDPVMSSDYSAYNHMGFWRDVANGGLLGQLLDTVRGVLDPRYRRNINSPNSYVQHVNERQRAVCDNIKAAGIEIYVVRFRSGDESVMRYCASDDDHFFNANNAQQLNEAFDAIGTGIGSLRLTH